MYVKCCFTWGLESLLELLTSHIKNNLFSAKLTLNQFYDDIYYHYSEACIFKSCWAECLYKTILIMSGVSFWESYVLIRDLRLVMLSEIFYGYFKNAMEKSLLINVWIKRQFCNFTESLHRHYFVFSASDWSAVIPFNLG